MAEREIEGSAGRCEGCLMEGELQCCKKTQLEFAEFLGRRAMTRDQCVAAEKFQPLQIVSSVTVYSVLTEMFYL